MELTYQASPVPLFVEGDAYRLQQVMMNLLENAKKYSSTEDRITVSLHQESDDGVIAIMDTGQAFPKKIYRIFGIVCIE